MFIVIGIFFICAMIVYVNWINNKCKHKYQFDHEYHYDGWGINYYRPVKMIFICEHCGKIKTVKK